MADELLTNAAVAWQRVAMDHLNSLDEPPADFSVSEDFFYEDHRSGGVNFGRLDSTGWSMFLRSMWDLSGGRSHRSIPGVIAVRGQRSAAVIARIGYGNDMFTEFIMCFSLDPRLRCMRRVAHYDLDDVDGAIAELDRLHAETEAGTA